MKRILIIFALFAAFALPAQEAQAYSFSGSGNLFVQIMTATGKKPIDWRGNFEPVEAYDIAVLYASDDSADPFAGAGANGKGFLVNYNTSPEEFIRTAHLTVYSALGTSVLYEYNGAAISLAGGTVFAGGTIDGVDYVFALTPNELAIFGNPPAVPVPAAAILLGSGLVGIMAVRRKMR